MGKTSGELLTELHRAKQIKDQAEELVESLTEQLVEAMKAEGQHALEKIRAQEFHATGLDHRRGISR